MGDFGEIFDGKSLVCGTPRPLTLHNFYTALKYKTADQSFTLLMEIEAVPKRHL